jgi:hypothetical protein
LTKADLIQFIIDLKRNVDALASSVTATPSPEPAPEPEPTPKPKHLPGSMQWFTQLAPPRTGDGVTMNELARSIPRARPPRAPGRQSRRFNGFWHY